MARLEQADEDIAGPDFWELGAGVPHFAGRGTALQSVPSLTIGASLRPGLCQRRLPSVRPARY